MTTQIRQFGEYHWRLFLILEKMLVAGEGNGTVYLSALGLNDRMLPVGSPAYWVVLQDLEAAGMLYSEPRSSISLLSESTHGNIQITLTDRGWRIVGQLRRWIAEGKRKADFKPDEPPAVEAEHWALIPGEWFRQAVARWGKTHQELHDTVHLADDDWLKRNRDAARSSETFRRLLYGDWSSDSVDPDLPQDRADAIRKATVDWTKRYFGDNGMPDWSSLEDAKRRAQQDYAALQKKREFIEQRQAEFADYEYREKLAHRWTVTFEEWLIDQLQESADALNDLFLLVVKYDCEIDIEEAAKEIDRPMLPTPPGGWTSEWVRVLGIFSTAREMLKRFLR